MFFKHAQQHTSHIIFCLKWDLVLSLIAPLSWQNTLREAAGPKRATKGKCPGESLEKSWEESREEFREEFIARSTRVAASRGSVQNAVSGQLVTVLHGNCCKWEHSENGNKNKYFLLSEHCIFGGYESFRDRQIFKMSFLTGLKGTLKAAARSFHWWRAVALWRRNWNYFKYRVWWKIRDKQFKTLDTIHYIWTQKYRLHWCVSGALRMVCVFAMFGNGGCVFPHGHGAAALWFPQHREWEQQSTCRLQGCGTSGSLFQLGFWCYCLWHTQWDISQPSRCVCPISAGPVGAGSARSGAQGAALSARGQSTAPAPVPSTPLTPTPADQPEMGAAALGSMDVL